MMKRILIVLALALVLCNMALAVDYTATQSGEFNTDATWGGGGHPTGAGDTADCGAFNIVSTATGIVCGAITVPNGGSLNTGANAATITSITTSGNGAVTIGTGGATLAGVLNNAGSGTLTISGAVTGVTTFTPGACAMNVNLACTTMNLSATAVLTMAAGTALTGMTAAGTWTSGGQVICGAGCEVSWACTSGTIYPSLACAFTMNGTSGSHCILRNVGGGTVPFQCNGGTITLAWTDVTNLCVSGQYGNGVMTLTDCTFSGMTDSGWFAVGVTSRSVMRRCFIYGNAYGMRLNYAGLIMENCVFGYNRAGAASTNTSADIRIFATVGAQTVVAAMPCTINNAILGSTTQVYFSAPTTDGYRCGLVVENLGHILASMLPGTASALDTAHVDAGVNKIWTPLGSWERSTANARTGTYNIRVTPLGQVSKSVPIEVPIYIPIQSGQNIAVSCYASRSGDSSDCAKLRLDPEGAWFTPDESTELLTNTATYYELTVSGATARGTGAKGMVRVVLVVDEYSAAQYVDFDDLTVTHGDATTTVSMQNWAEGVPVADTPPAAAYFVGD